MKITLNIFGMVPHILVNSTIYKKTFQKGTIIVSFSSIVTLDRSGCNTTHYLVLKRHHVVYYMLHSRRARACHRALFDLVCSRMGGKRRSVQMLSLNKRYLKGNTDTELILNLATEYIGGVVK